LPTLIPIVESINLPWGRRPFPRSSPAHEDIITVVQASGKESAEKDLLIMFVAFPENTG